MKKEWRIKVRRSDSQVEVTIGTIFATKALAKQVGKDLFGDLKQIKYRIVKGDKQ